MYLILLLNLQLACADEAVTPSQYIQRGFEDLSVVRAELACLQKEGKKGEDLITRPDATAMMNLLSPHLEAGFRKFGLGGRERALFYSQVIEESGAFTTMTESKSYAHQPGADPIGQLTVAAIYDRQFAGHKGAKKSKHFGQFRGRGLLQISGCENYLSVIHYLNLMDKGQPPVWRSGWRYQQDGQNISIGTVCSDEDLAKFARQYNDKFRMNADLYGILDNPARLAMVGAQLTDPMSKKTVPSEQVLVESSLAFWRGQCGKTLEHVADPQRLKNYDPCRSYASDDYFDHATKCLTKCVKGSTGDYERRSRWLKTAMACVRK